jgi:hypothetical protein
MQRHCKSPDVNVTRAEHSELLPWCNHQVISVKNIPDETSPSASTLFTDIDIVTFLGNVTVARI